MGVPEGAVVGKAEGSTVGSEGEGCGDFVGSSLGFDDGTCVGPSLGEEDGDALGKRLGVPVGPGEGLAEGE